MTWHLPALLRNLEVVVRRCSSQKFSKFHRKTTMLVSLVNKVADLKVCYFIKKRLQDSFFFHWNCQIIENTFFTEHLQCLLLKISILLQSLSSIRAQKMKFSVRNFFIKCDNLCRKLRIGSHLLMESVMESFIFVQCITFLIYGNFPKFS